MKAVEALTKYKLPAIAIRNCICVSGKMQGPPLASLTGGTRCEVSFDSISHPHVLQGIPMHQRMQVQVAERDQRPRQCVTTERDARPKVALEGAYTYIYL